jgi:serine/threonine protein phosphatase 1
VSGERKRLVRLQGSRRVWAVAAIHGEAERLIRLHDRIAPRFADGDRLVYLGNYLGRGNGIRATLDELLDFRRRIMARRGGFACDVVFLRGAQEQMWHKLLELQFAPNPGEVLQWMVGEGVEATVCAYGGEMRNGFAAARDGPRMMTRWTSGLRNAMNSSPGHTALLTSLRHAAQTHDGQVLFVHAGIDTTRSLSEQGDAFWWAERSFSELTGPFAGFRRIVRGFDRHHRGLVQGEFALSLDAGAGRGGPLLAAAIGPDGSVLEQLQG